MEEGVAAPTVAEIIGMGMCEFGGERVVLLVTVVQEISVYGRVDVLLGRDVGGWSGYFGARAGSRRLRVCSNC